MLSQIQVLKKVLEPTLDRSKFTGELLPVIDVPTESGHQTSLLRVIQKACELEMTDEDFISTSCSLVNVGRQAIDEQLLLSTKHLPKYTFRYVVQNLISAYVRADADVDLATMYVKSVKQAQTYIANNPWVFATGEDPNAGPKLDAAGNVAPKKGDKKALAIDLWNKHKDKPKSRKEWIELLVAEVGLTAPGASTYYHNLKTGIYK